MNVNRLLLICTAVSMLSMSPLRAGDTTDEKSTQRSRKNLQQIGLAFHNYHEVHGKLPGFANVNSDGKPLLSWRVHLLPYMGADAKVLHGEFRLQEPWDSEHNRKLIGKMPIVYAVPLKTPLAAGQTCYLVPRSKLTLFPPNQDGGNWQVEFSEIYQGLPNIILAVEADRTAATPWTKPSDLEFDRNKPLAQLGNIRDNGFLASWASGQISLVPNNVAVGRADPKEFLRGFFERVGNRGIAYYLELK